MCLPSVSSQNRGSRGISLSVGIDGRRNARRIGINVKAVHSGTLSLWMIASSANTFTRMHWRKMSSACSQSWRIIHASSCVLISTIRTAHTGIRRMCCHMCGYARNGVFLHILSARVRATERTCGCFSMSR